MSVTPEDIEAWQGLDKSVRDQILSILDVCGDGPEMSDESHPLHKQYDEGISLVKKMLSDE